MGRRKRKPNKSAVSNEALGDKNIFDIPVDVLCHLCTYLDDKCLVVFLKYICPVKSRNHRAIISLLNKRAKSSKIFWKGFDFYRCSPLDRFVSAKKWSKEAYRKCLTQPYVFKERSLIPRLCLDEEQNLWVSHAHSLLQYKLDTDGCLSRKSHPGPVKILSHKSNKSDITKFVIGDELKVAGLYDGNIIIWNEEYSFQHKAHHLDTHSVHFHKNFILSGSKDKTVALWQLSSDKNSIHEKFRLNMHDRVWNVKLHESLGCMAVGIAACSTTMKPITIWDIGSENCTPLISLKHEFKFGAGITDILFEDSNSLITSSYDTSVRLWDMRTGVNTGTFIDPYDTSLFSLVSDNNHTIFIGASKYSRIWLVDKRNMRQAVKRFQFDSKSRPVYSMALNTKNIFVTLDNCVSALSVS